MSRYLRKREKGKGIAEEVAGAVKKKENDGDPYSLCWDHPHLLLGEGESGSEGDDAVAAHANYYKPDEARKAKKKLKKQLAASASATPTHDARPSPAGHPPRRERRPKKTKKNVGTRGEEEEEEEEEDLEEVERLVRAATLKEGTGALAKPTPPPPAALLKELLACTPQKLDAAAELRRTFGNIAEVDEEAGGRPRLPQQTQRKSLFVTPDPSWPPVKCSGFDVVREEEGKHCVRESGQCAATSCAVRASIAADDPNRLAALAQEHPWHLRAAYHYGVMLCLGDRADEGRQVFRRLAHAVGTVLRGSFDVLGTPVTRELPYRPEGSDVIFLILQQLLHAHERTGCFGAALEVCKVVFNLDAMDPTGALYNLEYLSLRAGQPEWFDSLMAALSAEGCAPQALLPAATYGRALAHLRMGRRGTALAHAVRGVQRWPAVASSLLSGHPLPPSPQGSDNVVRCYCARMKGVWGEPEPKALLAEASAAAEGGREAEWVAEREFLLCGYGHGPTPGGVCGVVDEVAPGADVDRLHLRRHWTPRLNALPHAVRQQALDHIVAHDYSPLQSIHPVLLCFRLLLPWNTPASLLASNLLRNWRNENPTEAREWDLERELERRLMRRNLMQ